MKLFLGYLGVILLGYLLGCSNMAVYLSKLRRVDLREHGSGNLGASNAMTVFGWKAGVLVGIHDIGKGLLSVLLARWLLPDASLAGAAAGVACVLGHIFPFYLKFRGGKGLAAYIGMTAALNWKIALAIAAALVVITLVSDYIVFGTVTTILSTPICFGFQSGSLMLALILCIASVVMLFKHRDNFARLHAGTEIGLRGANRGEHRAQKP